MRQSTLAVRPSALAVLLVLGLALPACHHRKPGLGSGVRSLRRHNPHNGLAEGSQHQGQRKGQRKGEAGDFGVWILDFGSQVMDSQTSVTQALY